ncbi:DUF2851 family protein [Nafulsella turpanensis]|uniref:DUF2851 family protein n=1 Tax=Nafulsella turpanensis TaxID=1265690 RepID=UPI00034CE85B|nr:DUF2851 family protein [Nafulsella turpanensis]
MQESFLHFIWQYQYFSREALVSSTGEELKVLQQGMYNRQDAGPDFKGARLLLGELEWHGDVEIHLCSTDWERHQHQLDPAYNSVVLHVVWEKDGEVKRKDGTELPQLALKDRVEEGLLQRYQQLMQSLYAIPCAPQFDKADALARVSMLDKALLQRLKRKAEGLINWLKEAEGDWETVAYWLLAQNFGFKKNNEAFLALAQKLPLKLLAKHRNQPLQCEALLFGMAGFLESTSTSTQTLDSYIQQLQQEWQFLGHKYGLAGRQMQRHEWKFLRMRPANFPSLRLAQLAAVLQAQPHVFSLFTGGKSVKELLVQIRQPQSAYWQAHYDVQKASKNKLPSLGLSSAQNLLINTAAPLLAAYGLYLDDESWIERAMQLLQELPAESNSIVEEWKELGLQPQHAFDSQGMLELYNEFCLPKKCLQCSIGLNLLKRSEA